MWRRVLDTMSEPRDAAGLAMFRILFGATMCVGALRFLWNGWVDRFFVQPAYHLTYWGFDWVQVASPATMHAVLWAMAGLAAMVALGFCYRFAIVGFLLLFTYVELIDVANYLNHYVLVSMTAGVLAFLPAHAMWSVDARLRPGVARETIGRLSYDWLRFQVGAVWVSAAIAKMTTDWLVHAQPLNIWFNARVDTPIIGGLLDIWEVALAASWAGMLYDLTIPLLLLWRRTRVVAFIAVLGFHFMTHVWFAIGMFPVIMVVCATIFFDASWPRRFVRRLARPDSRLSGASVRATPAWMVPLAAVWCVALLVLPVRFAAYGGDVLWHEQGMRWAFKVMCREKNGAVTFRVRLPSQDREFEWSPRRWLTAHQEREMATQPDLILRLAHDVAADYRTQGHDDVEVYADAIASLNGRPPARLVDPNVDLSRVRDGIGPAAWILAGPQTAAPRLGRRLLAPPSHLAER